MLQRAEKRERHSPEKNDALLKHSRLSLTCKLGEQLCVLFCDEEGGNDGLHEVSTLQVDQLVWKSAELTGNSFI